jgi:formylglycine-generating enzyme required for sulfatase activity
MRYYVLCCIAVAVTALTASGGTDEPPKELTVNLDGGVKLELILLPAGEFTLGDDDNKPAHRVKITRPFYLGKHEVTQEEW